METKILMLTTVHIPKDQRIYYKESISNKKLGYDVEYLLPDAGKKRSYSDEYGIKITTVKRAKSKLGHPLTMLNLFKQCLKLDFDIIHCHEPGSLLVAIPLKYIKRKPVVYDIHEFYPNLIANNSIFPKWTRPFVKMFFDIGEIVLSLFADGIITVNEDLEQKFRSYNKNKIICTIPNYPVRDFVINPHAGDPKKLIYAGTIKETLGVREAIFAFEEVVKVYPDATLTILGDLSTYEEYGTELLNYCKEKKIPNVRFLDFVKYTDVFGYIKDAGIGLSLLLPSESHSKTVSVKVYEYMACGVAVVSSDYPLMQNLLERHRCGVVADPLNSKEVAEAIVSLIQNPELAKSMGVHGIKTFEDAFHFESQKLDWMYRNVAPVKVAVRRKTSAPNEG